MTYEELLNIKEGIVVLAGECSMLAQEDCTIPEVDFRTYSPEKRGLFTYPEGCYHTFDDGSWCSNHPLTIIKNCEKMVKEGWAGIILTNSHIVLEAIEVYCRKHKKTARFFLSEEKDKVEEHTNDIDVIYESFVKALHKLEIENHIIKCNENED